MVTMNLNIKVLCLVTFMSMSFIEKKKTKLKSILNGQWFMNTNFNLRFISYAAQHQAASAHEGYDCEIDPKTYCIYL